MTDVKEEAHAGVSKVLDAELKLGRWPRRLGCSVWREDWRWRHAR